MIMRFVAPVYRSEPRNVERNRAGSPTFRYCCTPALSAFEFQKCKNLSITDAGHSYSFVSGSPGFETGVNRIGWLCTSVLRSMDRPGSNPRSAIFEASPWLAACSHPLPLLPPNLDIIGHRDQHTRQHSTSHRSRPGRPRRRSKTTGSGSSGGRTSHPEASLSRPA